MLPQYQTCDLLPILIWRYSHILHSSLYSLMCLARTSLLSCSLCQKENSGQSGSAGPCGTSGWHSVARPCFHSWGWLMVQPPVLSSLTDFSLGKFGVIRYNEPSLIVFTFFPLVISWPVLSRLHPRSQLSGYSNNNTFTLFPCHSMVIMIND